MSETVITLADVAAAFRRHLWLLLGAAAVGLILAVVLVVLAERVYRAEVNMMPAATDASSGALSDLAGGFGGLIPLAGLNTNAAAAKNEALAILSSRSFTERFINEGDLLPVLYSGQWDAQAGAWRDADDAPTLWKAVKFFDRSVRSVNEDGSTGVITVAVEWRDPQLATEWANKLVADLNAQVRQRAVEEAARSIEYLNKELGKTNIVELERSIYELIEDQIKTIALANVRDEYAFRVIDPATTPDMDDYVYPNEPVMLILGLAVGATLGVVVVLLREFGFG